MVKTLRFKSNINCEECVKKVSPFLDAIPAIYKWSVDFKKPEKLLTITGENINASEIKEAVKKSGYEIHAADSIVSKVFSVFRKKKECCE